MSGGVEWTAMHKECRFDCLHACAVVCIVPPSFQPCDAAKTAAGIKLHAVLVSAYDYRRLRDR